MRGLKVGRKMAKRNIIQAARVQKTRDLTGKSARHIRRVINGECENEEVMMVYMELAEGENKLLQAVKTLLPFERNKDIELVMQYLPGPEADKVNGWVE
jgi:hypothetical protein